MSTSTTQITNIHDEAQRQLQNHTDEKETRLDERTDSGYSSQRGTPLSDAHTERKPENFGVNSNPFSLLSRSSKKKRKTPFLDLHIDQSVTERFIAIQPHFERLLLEHVRRTQKRGARYQPMSSRLMMMGSSREDAVAEIIVFCQPEQERSIKKFVKQQMIIDICKSSDPAQHSFKVSVIGNAPRLRSAFILSGVAVIGENFHPPSWEPTLCGRRITLKTPFGQSRNATCGGLIKVVTNDGHIQCYGITAGHVLQDLHEEHDDKSNRPLESNSDSEDDSMDTDDDSEIELDSVMSDFITDALPPSSLIEPDSWAFDGPFVLGEIIDPLTRPSLAEATRCYDWALFSPVKSGDGTSQYMNKLVSDARATIALSERRPGMTGNRSVSIMAGESVKKGHLLSSPGRIIIEPGQDFIDTYVITIDEETGICDGDSGSWVVDTETFELYGHLVASDIFGSGYVVPMSDVFSDIKDRLGAQSVELPSVVDIVCAEFNLAPYPLPALAVHATSPFSKVSMALEQQPSVDSGYSSRRITPQWPDYDEP
ncbi:Fc.00g004120.m01.CDS01 [Cosmosporella sp. VM-42]